jgi:translation initiation factor IF-1
MNYIREGDLVIVVGKIDTRVRDTINSDLIVGTVEQLLSDQQVSVILENGDLWVGPSRDVVLKSEQE